MLTTRKKKGIVKKHQKHKTDTGSANFQVALLSKRINELAAHLKKNPKDQHSRRGLVIMVGKRRKFLKYLSIKDEKSYKVLIKKLGLKS